MKYLVTSRAITNGGDYLITKKGLELIDNFLGKNNYTYVNGNNSDVGHFNFEEYQSLIVLGGPIYIDRLLKKESFPMLYKMKELGKDIYLFGCGWYGMDDSAAYDYRFSEEVNELLSYVAKKGILGCRDYLAERVLKSNGFQNTIMTGCPVWYGDKAKDSIETRSNRRKIVISDIGMTKDRAFWEEKYLQIVSVIDLVCQKYPDAEIIFTFNNGIETKYSSEFNGKVVEYLKKREITYYDLSNSAEKFSVYDDCNLHIGYRVHSHIYSLTKGISSVLICEDARGIGMNKTLGLEVIKANALGMENEYKNNPYLIKQLSCVLDELEETDYFAYQNLERIFDFYYENNVKRFFEIIKNRRTE